MCQEDYDEELRWRLEVLKSQLEEGKIQIAAHLADNFEQSLTAIKYGADGRIDLTTVDGRIRSMALMSAVVHNRQQEKDAAPLEDISRLYFEYIEKNLGSFINEAREKGYDAHSFASLVSQHPQAVDEISPQIPKFLEGLEEFWSAFADASHYHIQDIEGTKAVYGGDLFPTYQQNIASSVGLYIDTIVLSDPFWHSRPVFDNVSPKAQVYYLVKHAINLMQYRDLVLADPNSPIVVVTPFKSSVDENEGEFLNGSSELDGLAHANAIFGRKFESVEELYEFASDLDTPERAIKAVIDNERLLFDVDWTGSPQEKLERSLQGEEANLVGGKHPGNMIAAQCIGRMMQATDILLKSRYLSGTPLIDAPTSWQYFNWKLEYNSASTDDDLTHLHMIRGLQRVAGTDMEWLGNIPPAALIEMRKEGAFVEIREMLSAGVSEIAQTKPEAFFRSSDQIVENVQDAFEKHRENIKELRAKGFKFAGHDLGSWIVAGTIEVAAIATGTPAFGAAAFAINQIVDAPKLKEIPERFRKLRNAHTELKKSPMGLFFVHK